MLRRLWASIGFRLAFYYGVLMAVTMLAALAVIYLQTVGVMHQRMVREVGAVAQQLELRFQQEGLEAVAADIDRALRDGLRTEYEIYLLVDAQGRLLAGNLDDAQVAHAAARADPPWRVLRAGQPVTAYLVHRTLADGSRLVVGQDLREQQAIEKLVADASAAAGLVALVFLVGGAFLFRSELERSIAALRRTAARIAAGELQERVDTSEEPDEFALLKRDINAMLDRIQLLMDGVRHMSDTVAHNLRTPLSRILHRLWAAQDPASSAAVRRAEIDRAAQEIEDLAAALEKLLLIAEAEAGARRGHFSPLDLAPLADEVAEFYEALAEAQGTTLVREPARAAVVLGDRELLAGVLANLVDNALKHGGGTPVEIGTRVNGSHALLSVRDHGPGVPASALGALGDRFHRLDTQRPGHGLGLAGVRAVVALHGGVVRFANAAPGLRVEIELPLAEA